MDSKLKNLQETKARLEEKIASAPDSAELFKQGKITEEQYLHNQKALSSLTNKLETINKEIDSLCDKPVINTKKKWENSFRTDKKRLALSAVAVAAVFALSVLLFYAGKNATMKQKYNELNSQYDQLQQEYNDYKIESKKEIENSYYEGYTDGLRDGSGGEYEVPAPTSD